jgi:hypothetical protein
MIEQHLSVDDDVVKRKAVYRVAYHHWPELLILRNMNEKRSISKLISREEAGNYGNEFVNSSELPNDATLDDSSQMHVQAPFATEIEVSTLVASLYRTPKKPAAVDCGVSFSFSTVHVEPAPPMLLPIMFPSKSTAKPAFECSLPYFPSNLFNNSPSIQMNSSKMLQPTQPASNDPPSNAFFPLVNQPTSDFLSVDDLNPSNTNPELPTLPTPIDCCVFIPSNPLPSNPLPSNPTVDCCVMPDSPDIKLSVNTLHEYIKRKEVLTFLQTRQELTSQEHIYKPSRPCAIILFHVLSIIFKDWVKDALTELSFRKRETIHSTSTSNSMSTSIDSTAQDRLVVECVVPPSVAINRQDENIEVTDFFGWAISSLRRVLSREYERMKELRWDTECTLEEEQQMISFLDDMRIFHTQAILDEEYLRELYPPCHQLTNKGWLSLVSKQFFPFALYLLQQIRLNVDVNEWKRRGNGVIESAARALEENETLTVMFLDAAKTSSLDEKWKRKIMSALILKVLHARSAAEHDKYKEQHTNREAKGATASSFRGELKVLTKGAHNNNKVKRRKMN